MRSTGAHVLQLLGRHPESPVEVSCASASGDIGLLLPADAPGVGDLLAEWHGARDGVPSPPRFVRFDLAGDVWSAVAVYGAVQATRWRADGRTETSDYLPVRMLSAGQLQLLAARNRPGPEAITADPVRSALVTAGVVGWVQYLVPASAPDSSSVGSSAERRLKVEFTCRDPRRLRLDAGCDPHLLPMLDRAARAGLSPAYAAISVSGAGVSSWRLYGKPVRSRHVPRLLAALGA